MIRQGQAKRFSTESGNDEKLNSVDVSAELRSAIFAKER